MRSYISVYLGNSKQSLLNNQIPTTKIILPRDPSDSDPNCGWPLLIDMSLNDISFFIRTFQGDDIEWTAYQRDNDLGTSQQLVQTYASSRHQIIVRSNDRYRNGDPPSNNLLYICASRVLQKSSIEITPYSRLTYSRFNLSDNALTSFILDNSDSLYFVYTNIMLPLVPQVLTLTVNVETNNILQQVPKLFYSVCAYSDPDDCQLLPTQITSTATMTLLQGSVNYSTYTRTAIINHVPSVCPFTAGCIYFFSLYNQNEFGPVKISFMIQGVVQDVLPIQLFQEYQGVVEQESYQYFKVSVSPIQVANLNISQLQVKLLSHNGRAELYASTVNTNPKLGASEMSASSLSSITVLPINVQSLDLTKYTLYVGVRGASQASYKLKIDAVYLGLYPQVYNQLNYYIPPAIVLSPTVIISDQMPILTNFTQYLMNATYYYQPPIDTVQTILISPSISDMNGNVQFVYNLTNVFSNGTNVTIIQNSQSSVVLTRAQLGSFNSKSIFRIDIQLQISSSTGSGAPSPSDLAQSYLHLSFEIVGLVSLQAQGGSPLQYQSDLPLGSYVDGYSYQGTTIYRRLMMDPNATYVFTVTKILGSLSMMIKDGQMTAVPSFSDETTYDQVALALDPLSTASIVLTPKNRTAANKQCTNGTYTIRGGNNNCTLYVGIQCEGYCAYNLSVNLVGSRPLFNNSEPQLISEDQQFQGSALRGKAKYYYFPFIQNTTRDTVFALFKANNDSFLVARIITNAYLPYQNWTYPNNTLYDFISQSLIGSNEVIEITQQQYSSRCPASSSCALLVAVIGNGPSMNSTSIFSFKFMSQSNRIQGNSSVTGYIASPNSYAYYWFIVNTRVKSQIAAWSYLLSAGTQDPQSQTDLYASLFSSAMPSQESSDFISSNIGPDFLNITSSSPQIYSRIQGFNTIVVVGVYSQSGNSNFTLINWGPTDYGTFAYNVTDFSLILPGKARFDQRILGSFKVFRFFSFGTRDLEFNITTNNGSVYVLANSQPFGSSIMQPTNFEDAIQDALVPSFSGYIPDVTSTSDYSALNPFFNVPLFNATSSISPLVVKVNSSATIDFSKTSNGAWCQFCWYYLTVFQATLPANATTAQIRNTTVTVSVKELLDGSQLVPLFRPGQQYTQYFQLQSQVMQVKFLLETLDPFIINVTELNSGFISVYVTPYVDYINNPSPWYSQGTGPQTVHVSSQDDRFMAGVFYYITVVPSAANQNVTISLWQKKQVQGMKNMTQVTDRMWSVNDFAKFYYVIPPNPSLNYTVQFVVQAFTQGFLPLMFSFRNDDLNGTINYGNLTYPSPSRYSQKFERPFFQATNQTCINSFNITTTLSQQADPVTSKIVSVTNQTVYTLALYWSNFGFTDISETEYTISVLIQPLPSTNILSNSIQTNQVKNGRTLISHLSDAYDDGL